MGGLRLRLRLARLHLRVAFRSLVASRFDYYLGTAAMLVLQGVTLLLLHIAYARRVTLAGFSRDEATLIFGLSFTAQALTHIVAEGLWLLGPRYVEQGNLDYLLLRPVGALFQLVLGHLHSSGVVNLGLGLWLILRSLDRIGGLTPATLPFLAWFIAAGFAINLALVLALASLAFRHGRVNSLIALFTTLHRFLAYPLEIFPAFVFAGLTFVVPLAFTSYFPALSLLDAARGDHTRAWRFALDLGAVAVLALAGGLLAWRRGLAAYRSPGG